MLRLLHPMHYYYYYYYYYYYHHHRHSRQVDGISLKIITVFKSTLFLEFVTYTVLKNT